VGADIYEGDPTEPVVVPHDDAIRRTAWETFAECATYFTELRDSLGNILLDIDKLSEQRSLMHSASFWRSFIAASMDVKGAETQLWDFKKTLTMWHAKGEAKAKAKIEFAQDVAAFANARGGVILVGIADEPRAVVGLERGKELENRLQFAGIALKAHLEYDKDLVEFEQVEVQDNGVAKLCLITVVAQACQVVGVTDGAGHFTYPVRLQTGRSLGTLSEIGSRKTYLKSDNFDFVNELLQFVRDHGPMR
jgi:hypothetical protein